MSDLKDLAIRTTWYKTINSSQNIINIFFISSTEKLSVY